MTPHPYSCLMAQQAGRTPPKYRRIADDLRARIESGEYPLDAQLPTKAEMMAGYGAAIGTIDNALKVLAREGLVESVQGVGTFARKPREAEPSPEFRELVAQIRLLTDRMAAAEAWMARQEDRGE